MYMRTCGKDGRWYRERFVSEFMGIMSVAVPIPGGLAGSLLLALAGLLLFAVTATASGFGGRPVPEYERDLERVVLSPPARENILFDTVGGESAVFIGVDAMRADGCAVDVVWTSVRRNSGGVYCLFNSL